jgi:hypothetical protein
MFVCTGSLAYLMLHERHKAHFLDCRTNHWEGSTHKSGVMDMCPSRRNRLSSAIIAAFMVIVAAAHVAAAPSLLIGCGSGLASGGALAPQPLTPAVGDGGNVTVGSRPFYVSTDGSDLNAGSLARPWRTIQHAVDLASPGVTIDVRGGIYNESVNIRVSGTSAGGFITLQSYPGEVAILDGAKLQVPDNSQNGLINIQNQSYVNIEGLEIRNYESSNVYRVPAGINIAGAGSNVRILRNHIHHIATYAKGALCSEGRSNTANAFGIVAYGTDAPRSLQKLLVQGNEVDHLHTGCSESVAVNGNVQDWTIAGNTIHDNDNIGIDAIGFEQVAPDAAYDQARNGKIQGNTVYNITSEANASYRKGDLSADGIYVDGGASITIEHNLVRNVDIGIELASEAPGRSSRDIVVQNNMIYRSNAVGITIGGYDSTVGSAEYCAILNNTLVENDTRQTGAGEFQIQYNAANNVFKNNHVSAGEENLFVNSYASSRVSPAVLDANFYTSGGGSKSSKWKWRGTDYVGFASYQAGTGQDPHSSFN